MTVSRVPVSVRNKNPGSMWPGRASRKFGSATFEKLKDKQKNQAATFATSVDGAAAMMYLLATSTKFYRGHRLENAIATWSGGNDVNDYLAQIESRTALSRHDVIDGVLVNSEPRLIELCKAMAWHETGFKYPMTDAEWAEAFAKYQAAVSGGVVTSAKSATPLTKALDVMLSRLGETEIKGARHNPFIVDCFAAVGHPEIKDDETAWCAAAAGWALKQAGYAYMHGRLDARSYLNYGVAISEPEVGAVVVFWRESPNSWKGHVAIVESWTTSTVTFIGGNQNDAMTRETRPRTGSKSQVLGYRRPVLAVAPMSEVLASDSVKYKAVGALGIAASIFSDAIGWAGDQLAVAWLALSGLWDTAPQVATAITQQVKAGQTIAVSSGLPWPVYATMLIALTALALNLYETIKRKRARGDADTSAEIKAG